MPEETKGLQRRDFLKGVAVGTGALGAASLGLLAGCTTGSSDGDEATPTPTGDGAATPEPTGGWSWDTPPEPIADADISETIDTEIAVVGAGISGCAAACRASQLGAKVVVVEKQGWPSSRGGHYGGYQTNA
ncbi:MAG: FAD-dependent oxidoreductase, partial [Bifidobacteriaceae bacterium]|nr:FAD-dependent oxidoreductase [Bifidobacteriaceae bacterium]